MPLSDYLTVDEHFVPLDENGLEFLTDLAVNESQRWIEAVTRNKFRSPDFLESLEDGVLLCELVERIWPRYLQLDDATSNAFTRLYGQYTLEAFRGAVTKLGVDQSFVFLAKHIHAPERYICSDNAQDAIQEALIRVTVTVYLLGCRAKETPTYPGPQLDLTAFTQLFQHYLHHLHQNQETLCNQVDAENRPSPDDISTTNNLLSEEQSPELTFVGGHPQPQIAAREKHESANMPSRVQDDTSESEDPLGLASKNYCDNNDGYRFARGSNYADSIASSCDSACSSASPSVADSHVRHRSNDGSNSYEYVTKSKDSSTFPTSNKYTEVEHIKQKLKDDELEWQMNLDNWKSKRRHNLPAAGGESDDHDEQKDTSDLKLKTFPAMVAARLKRQGGALASYLEGPEAAHGKRAAQHDISVVHEDKENIPMHSKMPLHADISEKDSSSGVSSPRSSRSLTSVSPPPWPSAPSFPNKLPYQRDVPQAKPETTTVSTTKKVIYLKPLIQPKDATDSKNAKSVDQPQNPNIETTIKPFTEKLAMFQKAEIAASVVDPEKCNYKEFAKPEVSLKDKLSKFERSPEGKFDGEKKDSYPRTATVKSVKTAFEVGHVSQETTPVRNGSSGGLSRLLTKDWQSSTRVTPSNPAASEFDHSLAGSGEKESSEHYLHEIDGILGGKSKNSLAMSDNEDNLFEDLPPPPLPSMPPPPIHGIEEITVDKEHEPYFPPPPPPLDLELITVDSLEASDQEVEDVDVEEDTKPVQIQNVENPALRRMDSTKRIKTDILKRRSDFFGIKSDVIDFGDKAEAAAEKARPISFHELIAPKTVPDSITVPLPKKTVIEPTRMMDQEEEADLDRTQKQMALSLAEEEERWKQRDQAAVRSKENVIAMVLEDYKNEIRQENATQETKKTEGGILKNRNKVEEPAVIKVEKKPETPVLPSLDKAHLLPPQSHEQKSGVVIDKTEKITEERYVSAKFESTSREEMLSVDYLTVNARPPPLHETVPSRNESYGISEAPKLFHNLQHERYHSDGGYSSGRSDPGNSVRIISTVVHRTPPAPTMDFSRRHVDSMDYGPPRPPLPSEFKPPPYSIPFGNFDKSDSYSPQYVSRTAPLPPARMQPKQSEAVKKPVPAANVQNHWMVHEAEMRRLTDINARHTFDRHDRQAFAPVNSTVHPERTSERVSGVNGNIPQYTERQREVSSTAPFGQTKVDNSVKPAVSSKPTQYSRKEPTIIPSTKVTTNAENPSAIRLPQSGAAPHRLPDRPINLSPAGTGSLDSRQQVLPPSLASSQSALNVLPKPKMSQFAPRNPESPTSQSPAGAVTSKRRCAHCGEELGKGAAMIVENLQLFYHVSCFNCFVCGQTLGNGTTGADVRVRNAKLHCALCYSDDEGMQLSQL